MPENLFQRVLLGLLGVVAVIFAVWVAVGTSRPDALVLAGEPPVVTRTDSRPSRHEPAQKAVQKVRPEPPAASERRKDVAPPQEKRHEPEKGGLAPTDEVRYLLHPEQKPNPHIRRLADMPDGGVKMKINFLGGSHGSVFNDSNFLHIEAAEKIGVRDLSSVGAVWENSRKLSRVETNENIYLDQLTHSLPYLVPRANKLLNDIGKAFRDSLMARGGGDYRVKVTSVLRSPYHIKKLRRHNVNSIENSAHQYGTTFDISYAKFICNSPTPNPPRTQEDLKNLLAEVVYAMRDQGRCYVKYERKQGCFHITAR